MKRLLALLSLALLCAVPFVAVARQASAPNPLLGSLLDALNSKDQAGIEGFVRNACSSDVPATTRIQRLTGLAQRGAPFTLVRAVSESAEEIKAIVEDRGHMRLGLRIAIAEGKMRALMIGDPAELDAPPPKDYSGWNNLATLAGDIRRDTQSPALALAVMRQGRLEQAVVGTRTVDGKETVGRDEPFSIGSIGKPVCASVIGRLIEMGKLRWDTTLKEALPDLPMQPQYEEATLEQLMHHRSGVPALPGMRKPEVDRLVGTETDPSKIRIAFAKQILQSPPVGKPGERFEYSNAGYLLLGVIAERTTGHSYEQLVKDFVFKPLRLAHSYTNADTLPSARPSGHVHGPNGLEQANMGGGIEILFAPAGGGMYMSVGDLARFGQAHLEGLNGKDGFLKSETIKRLHQGEAEEGPGSRLYACGWGIESFPGITTMHTHNGSNGTMRSQLALFPEKGLVVAAFTNSGGESQPSPPLQAILAVARKEAPSSDAKGK